MASTLPRREGPTHTHANRFVSMCTMSVNFGGAHVCLCGGRVISWLCLVVYVWCNVAAAVRSTRSGHANRTKRRELVVNACMLLRARHFHSIVSLSITITV